MKITTEDCVIEWNGSHSGHVYSRKGLEMDIFTFAFEKNNPSALDFLSAANSYLEG